MAFGGGAGDGGWVAAAPFIQALGSVPGNTQSGSPKLSADGSAAAGFAGATSVSREPFRWTAVGGMTALPDVTPLPATDARAYGISGDGQTVVGGYNLSGASFPHNQRAFHYSAAPAGVVTTLVNPFGDYGVTATAASFDGGTIVGDVYDSGSANAGYRYSPQSGFQLLKSPTGIRLAPATAVTPDGAVIVGGGIANGGGRSGGYRWTAAGGYNPLPFDATAVSADGGVVAGYDQIANPLGPPLLTDEAFIWRQSTGTSVSLGDLPGGTFRSQALAISGDGSVVVGSSASGTESFDAFIWDAEHGMRQLRQVLQADFGIDMTGWRLTAATTISADGRYIGGSGHDPSGQVTAWIAEVPEPSGASVAMISLAAMGTRRRPRRWRRRIEKRTR